MDMRRLIDETDFDNLNELSKRWKKEPAQLPSHSHSHSQSQFQAEERSSMERSTISNMERLPQKENIAQQSNNTTIQPAPSEYQRKKREVMPQIMDQDTQHFRNRLQHLLNTFKTDAVSEFMGMKRSMLDYQKETIKNDTQRYLTMYEEKHQELLTTKEKLIALTTDLQRKTIQIDLMSAHIAKLNDRLKTAKHLSRPFSLLYENKVNEKMLKVKMADAARRDDRRLKLKAVTGWRNILREGRREREEAANQTRVQLEVAQVVGRFQKEMEMLREKLAQATRKNQEYENNKTLIQENLKKAFLRGISSMNMQAMGIFGGIEHDAPQNQHSQQPNNLAFSRNAPSNLNQTAFVTQNPLNQSALLGNSSVVVGRAKVQSKEHKWREAPVLGMEEKQEIQQPRMQLIRPTTEAKVIRVVDGRSNVETTGRKPPPPSSSSSIPSKVEISSRKKI